MHLWRRIADWSKLRNKVSNDVSSFDLDVVATVTEAACSGLDRLSVSDLVDQTADRLIERYRTALERKDASWDASREGLQVFLHDLKSLHPSHPALLKVQSFIDQQDKKSAH